MSSLVQAILLFLSLSAVAIAQVTPPTPAVPQAPVAGAIPTTPPAVGGIPLTPPAVPQDPAVGGIPFVPPLNPGEIIPELPIPGIIGGFLPGIGSGKRKEKCAACRSDCERKKRNRLAYAACVTLCGAKCVGSMPMSESPSDRVFTCTQNCALSASPRTFSDTEEANNYINYCYERCKN